MFSLEMFGNFEIVRGKNRFFLEILTKLCKKSTPALFRNDRLVDRVELITSQEHFLEAGRIS
jgi:hypothetical protein